MPDPTTATDECDTEALSLACDITRDSKGKVYVVYVMILHRELPLDAEATLEEERCETVLEQMEAVARNSTAMYKRRYSEPEAVRHWSKKQRTEK